MVYTNETLQNKKIYKNRKVQLRRGEVKMKYVKLVKEKNMILSTIANLVKVKSNKTKKQIIRDKLTI